MTPAALQDDYKHKGLRKKLVETIRLKGITDENILNAIEKIPRHWFLDSSFLEFAYEDKPFPIGCGQTISQPYTVAFQTLLLNVQKDEKILEIGTGSGYQACVLLELGAKVFTIERHKTLFQKTKAFLQTIGYNPKCFYGDGNLGLPAFAPFDKILITAAAPVIPDALIQQLKSGGIFVLPLGKGDVQTMTVIQKNENDKLITKEHGYFRFVPMLEDKNAKSI